MMDKDEYIQDRVDDQIAWYEKKSALNKKRYHRVKVIEIILAVTLPLISGLDDFQWVKISAVVGGIGATIAIVSGISVLYKYHDKWIEYRTTIESLKHERFMFLTNSGSYKQKQSFPLFVERVEGIISKENSKWAENLGPQQEEENPTPALPTEGV